MSENNNKIRVQKRRVIIVNRPVDSTRTVREQYADGTRTVREQYKERPQNVQERRISLWHGYKYINN